MAVTLGTKTLQCTAIRISSSPNAAEWHAWENGAWTIKRRVYGIKRVWELECIEENVAWADSAAKYAKEQAEQGNKVQLTIDEGERYNIPATEVYVLAVDLRLDLVGMQNVRRFTITVREA